MAELHNSLKELKLHYLVRDLKSIFKHKGEVETGFSFSKHNLDHRYVAVTIKTVKPKEIEGIVQHEEYYVKVRYEIHHRVFEGEKTYKNLEELDTFFEQLSSDLEKIENYKGE